MIIKILIQGNTLVIVRNRNNKMIVRKYKIRSNERMYRLKILIVEKYDLFRIGI